MSTDLVAQPEQHIVMTLKEAEKLDQRIVTNASTLQRDLLDIYYGEGYMALGYGNWGSYLDSVSERAGLGRKALYRWHKASLLLDHTPDVDISSMKEGTVRTIIDTLSDRKGFTEADRVDALLLAIELADGHAEKVTGPIAQTAACYTSVSKITPQRGAVLVERMRNGEVTPKIAHKLSYIMLDEDADGMEHIIGELGDVDLARYLVNLRQHGTEAYEELAETLEATGYLPTRTEEQIKIDRATLGDVVSYLDEPGRLRRHEKAVERTQAYKEVATLAARLAVSYWGIHPEVPAALEHLNTEREMYQLLLDLGFIKYGMKSEVNNGN